LTPVRFSHKFIGIYRAGQLSFYAMSNATIERLSEQARVRKALPPPAARRAIRLAAGATLGDVGEVIGVSKQAVHHWESGIAQPRGENLVAYVQVLDLLRGIA
jgi:DNA-binding transcriptional regulator YiaG